MSDFLAGIFLGVIIGAVTVPLIPPLFRLAERIRAWLNFKDQP